MEPTVRFCSDCLKFQVVWVAFRALRQFSKRHGGRSQQEDMQQAQCKDGLRAPS